MKRLIPILTAMFLVCTLHSCRTSQKIYVSARPGTEIYTPGKTLLATVPQDGKAKIKISSNGYYAFLLSRDAGTKDFIPFALDYKNHNYTLTRAAEGAGIVIAAAGVFSLLVGTIATVAGDEEVGTPFFVAGSAATLLGTGIGGPMTARRSQTQYKYRYKYLSFQQTNQDMAFTHPQLTFAAPAVAVDTTSTPSTRRIVKPASNANTDRAARSIRDNATKVAGTYAGTGRLLLGTEEVEAYETIKVVIARIDKNTVSVDVIDDRGESFFTSPGQYSITANKNGGYTLKHKSIPAATITIGKDKRASYVHPRVNIDNEIYKLEIKGAKK